MLLPLIFLLFSTSWPVTAESKLANCRASSSYELARENKLYKDLMTHDNILNMHEFKSKGSCQVVLENFQEDSLQQVEKLKNSKEFQEIVAELQSSGEVAKSELGKNLKTSFQEASLYIFVSFSMGEKALFNIAHEAKRFGAALVLRGFKEESYIKTAQALQEIITKTGQGVLIDPDLYSLFNIKTVPTFVLAKPFQLQSQERIQTPIHDKLQGHVSPRYALERFAKEGDLKQEALNLLHRGVSP